MAGGGASVRVSDKQDAEFLCKFCDNRKFKSSPNPPSQLPNCPTAPIAWLEEKKPRLTLKSHSCQRFKVLHNSRFENMEITVKPGKLITAVFSVYIHH